MTATEGGGNPGCAVSAGCALIWAMSVGALGVVALLLRAVMSLAGLTTPREIPRGARPDRNSGRLRHRKAAASRPND